MKSYKLIKDYPGLLDAGVVATWGKHGLNGDCYQIKLPEITHRFSSDTIESNPEYWEEIPEKPYEILSFTGKITESMYNLDRVKGSFTNKTLHSIFSEEELIKHGCKITSVKRLSDGKVFIAGEKIVYDNDNPSLFLEGCEIHYFSIMDGKAYINSHFGDKKCNGLEDVTHYVPERDSSCKILSFIWRGTGKGTLANIQKDGKYSSYPVNSRDFGGSKLASMISASSWDIHTVERSSDKEVFTLGDLITHIDNPWSKEVTVAVFKSKEEGKCIDIKNNFGGQHAISNINKQTPPLFVTEDGVNVFPGDSPYWVVTRKNRMHLIDYRGACANHNRILRESGVYKTFSTEEAANTYIDNHKILFTTEDGVGVLKGQKVFYIRDSKSRSRINIHTTTACNGSAESSKQSTLTYFSSMKAVQSHINNNIPRFSINDIKEVVAKQEDVDKLLQLLNIAISNAQ
jgi:hypothetical protein